MIKFYAVLSILLRFLFLLVRRRYKRCLLLIDHALCRCFVSRIRDELCCCLGFIYYDVYSRGWMKIIYLLVGAFDVGSPLLLSGGLRLELLYLPV